MRFLICFLAVSLFGVSAYALTVDDIREATSEDREIEKNYSNHYQKLKQELIKYTDQSKRAIYQDDQKQMNEIIDSILDYNDKLNNHHHIEQSKLNTLFDNANRLYDLLRSETK